MTLQLLLGIPGDGEFRLPLLQILVEIFDLLVLGLGCLIKNLGLELEQLVGGKCRLLLCSSNFGLDAHDFLDVARNDCFVAADPGLLLCGQLGELAK